jgi:lysophospholipase L1-like esterase
VLVIGDSISSGYFPFIKAGLPDYDVIHNPCNAKDSRNGAAHIHYWLGLRPKWSTILFNHGAWDVSPRREVDGNDYATYIRYEAIAIKKATTNPIFVLTTSVPVNDPTRSIGSEVTYNQIAIRIMDELGIPYVDLYSLSLTIPQFRLNPELQNDVHWQPNGSAIFGQAILEVLQ